MEYKCQKLFFIPPGGRQIKLDSCIFKGFVCKGELGALCVGVELRDLAAEVVFVGVQEVNVRSFFVLIKIV